MPVFVVFIPHGHEQCQASTSLVGPLQVVGRFSIPCPKSWLRVSIEQQADNTTKKRKASSCYCLCLAFHMAVASCCAPRPRVACAESRNIPMELVSCGCRRPMRVAESVGEDSGSCTPANRAFEPCISNAYVILPIHFKARPSFVCVASACRKVVAETVPTCPKMTHPMSEALQAGEGACSLVELLSQGNLRYSSSS